jgi:hypothetical protein
MSSGTRREKGDWSRRRFLLTAGSVAALAGAEAKGVAAVGRRGVSLVIDPEDKTASSPESLWAAKELEAALLGRGVDATRCQRVGEAKPGDVCLVLSGANSSVAKNLLKRANATIAERPEALGVYPGEVDGRKVTLVSGHDPRAMVYAVLDIVDRVQNSSDAIASIGSLPANAEQPANEVRSITRLFVSDIHDKPWYNDREMWPHYLTMLAAQRFNRFNLAFGIGYDFIRNVTDAYFLFTYPFLVDVPGYGVRVPQLSNVERERNLEMLRYIGKQTVMRGLEFHVGLWMHGYEWINSPNANYTIEGLTKETHGPYCRDAVRTLLKACPQISGVTFRIHGESGVQEGSYEFWKNVFDGVATCGRPVKLDMHTKGMDQTMTDIALASKLPVSMSPKFWGEHMGMSYHQADIRELEQPKPGDENKTGLMKLSGGTRSFLRYGYGDLLREDREWMVVHRIWPGTQRLLLWGDPEAAAGYSRCFSFCGSNGVELCEPLSFKGRRGSGLPGGRCAYADATLNPRWDWEKYEYSYRMWGRMLYNPDTAPEVWQRTLRYQFGEGAAPLEASLGNASRILPIITTAHAPSAGNNTYWPEVYWNQSFVDTEHPGPYGDSPTPKVFGNASPLDPQLFSRMNDFAAELLSGDRSGKYSPVEVAQWIEDYAQKALASLKKAESVSSKKNTAEYRRLTIDIAIQALLGQFFGAKFRSGVLFGLYEKSGDRAALIASIDMYRKARAKWVELVEISKGVYLADITVGEEPQQRGNWSDRLAAIDKDIAAVSQRRESTPSAAPAQARVAAAIDEVLGRPKRWMPAVRHEPSKDFRAGQPLEIRLSSTEHEISVTLYYRHVDQAERYTTATMKGTQNEYYATIPADYTSTEYPLEYYFEVRERTGRAGLYPGFSARLVNQPYFVVRRS